MVLPLCAFFVVGKYGVQDVLGDAGPSLDERDDTARDAGRSSSDSESTISVQEHTPTVLQYRELADCEAAGPGILGVRLSEVAAGTQADDAAGLDGAKVFWSTVRARVWAPTGFLVVHCLSPRRPRDRLAVTY